MRKVAGALLATAAGLIALLSFKSHTPAATSALTAAEGSGSGSGTSALNGPGSGPSAAPTPSPGASSPAAPSGARTGKNGTFTGAAADTMYGPVQVRVTLAAGKITHVDVLQVPDNGRYEAEIVADALPILQSEALSAQSANIDIVSGATYTSQGYAQSLQSALNQAGIK